MSVKKIIFTMLFVSNIFGQDKMLLKSSEEIILEDRTNFINYDTNYNFIAYRSKYFSKNKIAILTI